MRQKVPFLLISAALAGPGAALAISTLPDYNPYTGYYPHF